MYRWTRHPRAWTGAAVAYPFTMTGATLPPGWYWTAIGNFNGGPQYTSAIVWTPPASWVTTTPPPLPMAPPDGSGTFKPLDAQAVFAAKAAADKAAADAMAAKLAASPAWAFYRIASPVSAAVSAFHGYRRNRSIGWALAWAVAGGLLPVIVPVIALAQGFGKRKAP